MALPATFATTPAGTQRPGADLDNNFNAVGATGIVPCTATGSNAITLAPFANNITIGAYANFQAFAFVAVANSTGAVTGQVGSLPFIPVYLAGGTTQAGNNDIVAGQLYVVSYQLSLNAGAGGLVITSAIAPAPAVAGGFKSSPRQAVLAGLEDANGAANHINTAAGLAVTLSATASPLALSYAGGFTSAGAADVANVIAADQAAYWTVPASETSFLSADYVSAGAVPTATQTLAPPQYGPLYDKTKQSVLQFGGAAGATTFLDDFGNTWGAVAGAKVQNTQVKFGTGALGGSGPSNALAAGDYIRTTNIVSPGTGSWALRCWFYCTTAPGAGSNATLMALENAGRFGIELNLNNNTGTFRVQISLSSNGSSYDIVSGQNHPTVITLNAWHFAEVTFDALAGVYSLYVDAGTGVSTTSSLRCFQQCSGLFLANNPGTANPFLGYIDKPEFLPYCQHPSGSTVSLPLAAPNVATQGYASDWFDTVNYTMKQVNSASASAGANPGFAAKNRLYLGEVDAGAASISAFRSYAFGGRYVSPWTSPLPAAGVNTAKNVNMGTQEFKARLQIQNIVADHNYLPGDIAEDLAINDTAVYASPQFRKFRNGVFFNTGRTGLSLMDNGTGIASVLTAASWQYRVIATRDF